jgi:hypothetical protein
VIAARRRSSCVPGALNSRDLPPRRWRGGPPATLGGGLPHWGNRRGLTPPSKRALRHPPEGIFMPARPHTLTRPSPRWIASPPAGLAMTTPRMPRQPPLKIITHCSLLIRPQGRSPGRLATPCHQPYPSSLIPSTFSTSPLPRTTRNSQIYIITNSSLLIRPHGRLPGTPCNHLSPATLIHYICFRRRYDTNQRRR